MIDRVLFLGQGGRTVYSGSVDEAEAYFSKIGYPLPPYVNPADFYMDVISGSVKNERNVYVNLTDEWEKHKAMMEEEGLKRETNVGEPLNEIGVQEGNCSGTSSPDSGLGSGASSENVLASRAIRQSAPIVKKLQRMVNFAQGMLDWDFYEFYFIVHINQLQPCRLINH